MKYKEIQRVWDGCGGNEKMREGGDVCCYVPRRPLLGNETDP